MNFDLHFPFFLLPLKTKSQPEIGQDFIYIATIGKSIHVVDRIEDIEFTGGRHQVWYAGDFL